MPLTATTNDETGKSLRDQLKATNPEVHASANVAPPDERWAAIPGFAGQYTVSSLGRVLRLANMRSSDVRLWWPRLLEPTLSGGYLRVFLRTRGGHRRLYRVDRIALCAFTRQPLAVFDVAYKNGNRRDLRLENLERLDTITVLGPPGSRQRNIEAGASLR